jgi:eukaryotic-like serine/threonine-protein kinase
VFLSAWMEGLRPVRSKLLGPLAAVFRDHRQERTPERTLATSILADYAADRPEVVADLLLDADEKQFAGVKSLDGPRYAAFPALSCFDGR